MRNNILKKTMTLLLAAAIAVTSANVPADAKSALDLAGDAWDAADEKAKASGAKCDLRYNPDTFDEAVEYQIISYLNKNEDAPAAEKEQHVAQMRHYAEIAIASNLASGVKEGKTDKEVLAEGKCYPYMYKHVLPFRFTDRYHTEPGGEIYNILYPTFQYIGLGEHTALYEQGKDRPDGHPVIQYNADKQSYTLEFNDIEYLKNNQDTQFKFYVENKYDPDYYLYSRIEYFDANGRRIGTSLHKKTLETLKYSTFKSVIEKYDVSSIKVTHARLEQLLELDSEIKVEKTKVTLNYGTKAFKTKTINLTELFGVKRPESVDNAGKIKWTIESSSKKTASSGYFAMGAYASAPSSVTKPLDEKYDYQQLTSMALTKKTFAEYIKYRDKRAYDKRTPNSYNKTTVTTTLKLKAHIAGPNGKIISTKKLTLVIKSNGKKVKNASWY